MHAPDLNLIVVVGLLDGEPFRRRDLEISTSSSSPFPASTRAVVFVAGDLHQNSERAALVRWARRNVKQALDHGIGCLVAAVPGQENLASQTLASSAETNQATISTADAETIAQACLRLQPGPLPNDDLTIHCEESLDAETTLLLRRAFRDFDAVQLEILTGGRSAKTTVWRVDARSSDAELRSPFVAKCGPRDAIDMQVRTYRDVVADRVPYRGCAPLCLERSVAGFSKRISVSRFVEGAARLDELLIDPDHPNVQRLIDRIYTGPLHRWRSTVRRQTLQLMWEFLPRNVNMSYGRGLRNTRRRLERKGVEAVTPAVLLRRLRSLPRVEVPICRAHDDLNFRNVFVAREGSEIILIDFTRAVERPLSKDIARMDVGFAFDSELNSEQPIADETLLDYFTGDLFSISLQHVVDGRRAGARLAAIQALRHHVLTEAASHEYDPRQEYKVAVIAGLLYEAKRQTPWSEIAYRCADQLSATL